jgi:hypothetical protein
MFIVRKHPLPPRDIILIKRKVYATFKTLYKKKVREIFYPTPNKSMGIPPDTLTRKGLELEFFGVLDLGTIHIIQGVTTFEDSDGSSLFDPLNGNSLVGLDLYGNYRSFVPIKTALSTINNQLCLLRVGSSTDETYRRLIHAGTYLNSLILQTDPGEELGCLFYNT